ncbi:MAG TPA: serine/threonine-protein kinase [Polyangia bacterium]
MLGRTVGNYVVERKIGEGGMGAVYLARHPRIGKEVAVKVLLPAMSRDPELVQRFFVEAKAAAEIKDAHIVDVLDFGELDDGSSYIVMEWLEGRSLAELLGAETRLPLSRAQKIARGIGRALSAAHARGIVHRDLKPDNIFLVRHDDDHDFVKVLDFGIAKLMDGTDVKTRAGAILGTPYYMSPEQCQGRSVDTRADVYSLGVILYQMVTGRLPFEGQSLGELLMAHLSRAPPRPRTFEPSLPPAAEEALLQALAKDPEERFARVEALVTAFCGDTVAEAATAPVVAAPVVAAPAPNLGRTSELFVRIGVRGKRGMILGGGVVVVAIAAAIALATHHSAPPADGSVAPAIAPAAATSPSGTTATAAAPSFGGVWRLAHTDCLPGAMPAKVSVQQSGASFSVAGGVPTTGEIGADGRFVTRNRLGTCRGTVVGRISKETCTNAFHQSCHATYERAD